MIFETRFITWGISRRILFLMGLLPFALIILGHQLSPIWFFPAVLGVVLWIFSISRGHHRMLPAYGGFMILVLLLDLFFSLREKNLLQMLFDLLSVFLALFCYQKIETQLGMAHNQPGIKWYEGIPKLFPRVQLQIRIGEQWVPASLRRMDHHGLFLFLNQDESLESFQRTESFTTVLFPIRVGYRDLQFEGEARIRSIFIDRVLGIGLQIVPKDLYHFTQYDKIVRVLKGEGYAT